MPLLSEKDAISFEEFLERPDHDRFELVEGRLQELQGSALSSHVAAAIIHELIAYSKQTKSGRVFSSEIYYRCFPDQPRTGRKPDASFVSDEKLPEQWRELGYFSIAPDLAVEVVSAHDLAYEVSRKTRQYLKAGVRLVWNVDPSNRIVQVHRANGTTSQLEETETLDGEDVLPGFSCRIADLFPPGPAEESV